MLYTCYFEIDGIVGPSGYVSDSRDEIVEAAKGMGEIALDQMDDATSTYEWYDLSGNAADPRTLLDSDDSDEVLNVVAQISDTLKPRGDGFIDVAEFNDIFELLEWHRVSSWCSAELRDQIKALGTARAEVLHRLSDEWAPT